MNRQAQATEVHLDSIRGRKRDRSRPGIAPSVLADSISCAVRDPKARRQRLPGRIVKATMALAVLPDLFQMLPVLAWWWFGGGSFDAVRAFAVAMPGQEPAAASEGQQRGRSCAICAKCSRPTAFSTSRTACEMCSEKRRWPWSTPVAA